MQKRKQQPSPVVNNNIGFGRGRGPSMKAFQCFYLVLRGRQVGMWEGRVHLH